MYFVLKIILIKVIFCGWFFYLSDTEILINTIESIFQTRTLLTIIITQIL